MSETAIATILSGIFALTASIIVALLSNWEKLNPRNRKVNEVLKLVEQISKALDDHLKSDAENEEGTQDQFLEHAQKFSDIMIVIQNMSSAQRAILQANILEDCRVIQKMLKSGDLVGEKLSDYNERLKQLIILFREYYLCGHNNQAKLYFDETLTMSAEFDNGATRALMSTLFPEYDPTRGHS